MSANFENLFAIPEKTRRRPLIASLKGLALVVALTASLIVLQSQTRQWLLHRWVSGFADLPPGEQIERLLQIDMLGDLATETIVRRIAADDDRVAAAAMELVRGRQSSWATLDDDSMAFAHQRMLDGLDAIADVLPGTRAGWVTQLLNQTVVECVDQRGDAMKATYQDANRLLTRFADAGPSINQTARGTESTSTEAPSLVPLPVRLRDATDDAMASVAASPINSARSAAQVDPPRPQPPTIIARGSSDSVSTGAGQTEQAVHRVASDPAAEDAMPASLSAAPLKTFDTKSVIGLLASKQAVVRDQAVTELVRRGLSNEEIRIANQLAAPQVEVRLGLLDSIVRRSDIDPRPWLLWLTEDPIREVRLRSVSALASMADDAVVLALRKRLTVESDPAVIASLRQVVDRR